MWMPNAWTLTPNSAFLDVEEVASELGADARLSRRPMIEPSEGGTLCGRHIRQVAAFGRRYVFPARGSRPPAVGQVAGR
ncbi:hypothetical protein M2284_001341 [Rhodococcus sp. LBL1]|nr:hypothetical protein [Rhodococcus sp. LBL1]MDH6682564.1 hypothetical protein [Rhodococcus sp. LBL2]